MNSVPMIRIIQKIFFTLMITFFFCCRGTACGRQREHLTRPNVRCAMERMELAIHRQARL